MDIQSETIITRHCPVAGYKKSEKKKKKKKNNFFFFFFFFISGPSKHPVSMARASLVMEICSRHWLYEPQRINLSAMPGGNGNNLGVAFQSSGK